MVFVKFRYLHLVDHIRLFQNNIHIKYFLSIYILISSCCSRHLAETSPYFEALRKRNVEVLFLYEPYDELVLINLGQYDRKTMRSIENELYEDKENTDSVDPSGESFWTFFFLKSYDGRYCKETCKQTIRECDSFNGS